MSIRGIILIIIALLGVILNFSSRRINERFAVSELKIKVISLIIVLVCVTLLMIFGK